MEIQRELEQLDDYEWSRRSQLITKQQHHISGLGNLTHFHILTSEPPTPMHYHDGIMEIMCVARGSRECCLMEADGEHTYGYTGNEAFVVFPNELHTNARVMQSACEGYAVQLDLREEKDFLNLNEKTGTELCAAFRELKHRHYHLTPAVLGLLRSAFELFAENRERERAEGVGYLICFLYGFLKLDVLDRTVRGEGDAKIAAALAYIRSNITEPIGLEELANVSGYSLSHFKTRFREETGYTPANYINGRKMEKAKELLERTDQSVTEIAYGLGWSTSNYFCTVFRRMTGMSPLQYRKAQLSG